MEPGAGGALDGIDLREETVLVAKWVEELAGPAYGPQGGAKLLVDPSGGLAWTRSGATAVREAAAVHPALAPYQALATSVSKLAGDQATAALLLAAALVRSALSTQGDGLVIPSSLQGYALAHRQVRAWLAAHADAAAADVALSAVGANAASWTPVALAGLRSLATPAELDGLDVDGLDLEAIDVHAEPEGEARWLSGLLLRPREEPVGVAPTRRQVKVLVVFGGWNAKARAEGASYRYGAGKTGAGAWGRNAEALRARAVVARLEKLGVGVVLASKAVDADVADALRSLGILVWTDAPRSALDRAIRATGAKPVPDLQNVTGDDLGNGHIERRPHRRGGWLLSGKGPSATFVVPAANGLAGTVAVEEAERLLRAAGQVLRDARSLPGGGRWQRGVATALRNASDAAPGKAPLAIRGAADAFDALADHLCRNSGADPLLRGFAPGADQVRDAYACVRIAVDAAFELAQQLVRIDARHVKAASSAAALRGGTGPSGSLKGMPGDNPPLM